MVAKQDYTWNQGEDLIIDLNYQINGVAVDLTNYAARMDIAPATGTNAGIPIFTFNSEDMSDTTLDTAGAADNEITLDATGHIFIVVPRALTLPGGAVGDSFPSVKEYSYDLFLRNKDNNTQKKLLEGKIAVTGSITKWL